MKSYIAMGIFSFVVAMLSLLQVMADHEFYRLTSMKRVWGRSRGLALHFLANAGLPLVCGVIFMSSGISGVKLIQPLIADNPFDRVPTVESIYVEDYMDALVEDSYTLLAA
ncbi:MAG: hypothetical protein C0623_10865 [Desulfuromonas sp.]|nr:MAG: hypothetical protein C0623_10865 [Desulfuromonas sp.]